MGDKTSFGDRMKMYENQIVDARTMPLIPVMARLDGKAFHSFCRDLERPFDQGFHQLMVQTGHSLLEKSNALICYVQSDEISLCWLAETTKTQIFMGGRIMKMVSVLAGIAADTFNTTMETYLPEKNSHGLFDCRVWQVPNKTEGANVFLWREQDATRNSVLGLGQAHFSHRQLHRKCQTDIHDLLYKKGVNWNNLPAWAKRGTWLQKQRVVRPFTVDEINNLPPKHEAHTNPELVIERWQIQEINMPSFGRVTNRTDVIFHGAEPQTEITSCSKEEENTDEQND